MSRPDASIPRTLDIPSGQYVGWKRGHHSSSSAPSVPLSPIGTAGDASVSLSWLAPTSGASVYRVYRDGVLVASPSGLSVIDHSGSSKVYLESRSTAGWDAAITRTVLSGIPWSAFRFVVGPPVVP